MNERGKNFEELLQRRQLRRKWTRAVEVEAAVAAEAAAEAAVAAVMGDF